MPKPQFSAWSKRLERLWGNSFANLQRIQQPKAAGTYIIKAVGYADKGENADQGLIKGNRYNIAQCSRAPGWPMESRSDDETCRQIVAEAKQAACIEYANSYHQFKDKRAYW